MTARANFITAIVFTCLYSGVIGAAVAIAVTGNPFVLIALVGIALGLPRCIDVLLHEKRDSREKATR